MSDITITPITLDDIAGFHACLDEVAREGRYLAQLQAPPLDRVAGFVADSVRDGSAQLVARDGGRVVGWADIFPAWPAAMAHCGTLGMGVLASHRGRGIGERLLTACLAKARATGITRVTLEARTDNAPALALYAKLGFEVEARKRRALRFDGQYFDALQMSLLFDEPASATGPNASSPQP